MLSEGNQSITPTFILLGFLEYPVLQVPLFLVFFLAFFLDFSFSGSVVQFCFAQIFGVTETVMLEVMACDSFVAICNPLLYITAISQKLCVLLVAGSCSWGIVCSLTFTYFLLTLSYHESNIINNFICDHSVLASVS